MAAGDLHEEDFLPIDSVDYSAVAVLFSVGPVFDADNVPDAEAPGRLERIEEIPVFLRVPFPGYQITDELRKTEAFTPAACSRGDDENRINSLAAAVPVFPVILAAGQIDGGIRPTRAFGHPMVRLDHAGRRRPVPAVKQLVFIDNGIEVLC